MAQKRPFARVVSEWSLVFAVLACVPPLCWVTQRQEVPIGAHGGRQGSPETALCVLALVGISVVLWLIGVFAAPSRSNRAAVWTLLVWVVVLLLLDETASILYS